MVAGALNADPAKFESKSAKSVRSRIGNIRDFLKTDMDLAAFWDYLKKTLAGSGLVEDHLTAEELAAVEELKRTKYDTWEWNFGRSPKYNLRNKRRWDGGTLEPCVEVDQGIIRQIVFYGDFLAVSPLDEVTEALVGTPVPPGGRGGGAGPLPPVGVFRHHHPGPGAGHHVSDGAGPWSGGGTARPRDCTNRKPGEREGRSSPEGARVTSPEFCESGLVEPFHQRRVRR